MRLRLLGSPRLEVKGACARLGRRKSLALLAYLALTGQPHDRISLAVLFWPESERASALAALRQCLSEIKKRLGAAVLQADRYTVSLPAEPPFCVDVLEFRRRLASGLRDDDLAQLVKAADLYQGDFMADFVLPDTPEFDEWQRDQAESLRRELSQALAGAVQLLTASNRAEEALPYANRYAALEPGNETAQAQLLRLYIKTGQITAAVERYEQFSRRIESELGRPPTFTLDSLLPDSRLPDREAEAEEVAPAPATTGRRRAALPRPATPFAGRTSELAKLVTRLKQPGVPLLTIIGPGGAGKTRLALAAARQLETYFPDGVYFVSLEAVEDAAGLLAVIANTLAIAWDGHNNLEIQLMEQLQERHLLLVLDNFEQLTPHAAFLTRLLLAAPGVKFLVTSRIRLKLQEEWSLLLHGMAYPSSADDPAANSYEAVDFLQQCIRQNDPDYRPTRADLPYLVHICQLVEGLPLALELAAAWVKHLSYQEIIEALVRQPERLTAAWADPPDSRASLEAVCARSWQLLTPEERQCAQWLTLFRGSFDQEAAKAAGVSRPLLAALVDKSLLRRLSPETGSDDRFQMHAVIRRYIQRQLEADKPAATEARRRYARYYAAFLRERDGWLEDGRQATALNEIQRDIANIRAAWRWAAVDREEKATAAALSPLHRFYDMKGMFCQGVEDFELALTHWQKENDTGNPAIERLVGRLALRQGLLLHRLSDLDKAETLLLAGIARLSPHKPDSLYDIAIALQGLGKIAIERREWLTAREKYQESLTILQTLDRLFDVAQALSGLGRIASGLAEYEEAAHLYQESLALYQKLGAPLGVAVCLNNLSHIAEMAGNYRQAALWLQLSLTMAEKASSPWLKATALSNLAHIALLQKQPGKAKQYLKQSLTLRQRRKLPGLTVTRQVFEALREGNLKRAA